MIAIFVMNEIINKMNSLPVNINEIEDNYQYTNEKLKELVETGQAALDEFKEICDETKEPRAYEVLATLLKTTGDLTKSILETSKTKAQIHKDSSQGNSPGTVNNTQYIFNGTTKDLLDSMDKETIIDVS